MSTTAVADLDPALSHTRGETEPPLLDQTIPDNLDATVARFGDRLALVDRDQGIRWSYTEFAEHVDELARAFVAIGVEKGERVGIWAPNMAQWTLVQYATAKTGIILVNINPAYRTHELEYVLRQAGIAYLVAVESFKTSNYRSMIEQVEGGLDDLRGVAYINTQSWDDLLARAAEVSADQVAQLQAGSTPTTRSTSSTPPAQPDSPRARPSRTATSSTTGSSSGRCAATRRRTRSASRCRSTTASGWSWATSPARATGRRWSFRRPASTRP